MVTKDQSTDTADAKVVTTGCEEPQVFHLAVSNLG